MPCKLANNALHAAGLILACWIGTNPLRAADDAPERWTYRLDPSAQPLAVSAEAVGRVRRGGPAHAVVVAGQPSPFVLTSSGDSQNPLAELWDLRRASPVSRFSLKRDDLNDAKLSSDGRLMVGRQFDNGHFYSTVWDMATGKVVWQEGKPDIAIVKRVNAKLRDFVGSDEVVLIGESWIRIVNFRTNELVREFQSDTPCLSIEQSVLSPGRRFLARHESAAVYIYSLDTGEVAGVLRPPKIPDTFLAKIVRFHFSLDGKELAALVSLHREVGGRQPQHQAIASWSLTDGKLAAQHELNAEVVGQLMERGNYVANIACLPDHSGWWVNNGGLIDRATGKIAWLVPKLGPVQASGNHGQFLDGGRLLVHVDSPQPADPVFGIVKTPRNWKLAAAPNVQLADKKDSVRGELKPPPSDVADARTADPEKNAKVQTKTKAAAKSKLDPKARAEDARLKKVELIRDEERVPLRAAEIEECIRDLSSGKDEVIIGALEKLALALPDPKYTKRIVRETQAFLPRRDNRLLNRMAGVALQNWDKASRIPNDLRAAAEAGRRTQVDLKKVESDITSGNVSRAFDAIEYLGTTGDARAAEILVKHYERYRGNCAKALRALGAPAAPAVVQLLKSKEVPIRISAAELLKDIGTAEEIAPLEDSANDPNENALVRKKATEAISSIKRRK